MSLTEFLEARIAEDEANARKSKEWEAKVLPVNDMFDFDGWYDQDRVLAECATKRAIIAVHTPDRGGDCPVCTMDEDFSEDSEGNREWYRASEAYPCVTLSALAAPYRSHPDYQVAWGDNPS